MIVYWILGVRMLKYPSSNSSKNGIPCHHNGLAYRWAGHSVADQAIHADYSSVQDVQRYEEFSLRMWCRGRMILVTLPAQLAPVFA